MRPSGRRPEQMRAVQFLPRYTRHAEGAVLAEFGDTRVLCTASIEPKVPPFLKGRQEGWVTAEYGMLPRATHMRTPREAARGKQGGRTLEIQRLIGRSLRAVVDRAALGEHTITIDCDVLQADGGTRTAADLRRLHSACAAAAHLTRTGKIARNPIHGQVAAVSVGIFGGVPVLDLDYAEDSEAETDMNVVMNEAGGFIEMQGTAEGHALLRSELTQLLDLAERGIKQLLALQSAVLRREAVPSAGCSRAATAASSLSSRSCCATPVLRTSSWLRNRRLASNRRRKRQRRSSRMRCSRLVTRLFRRACRAIADDSGLAVDALGGAPGVRSARFAGDERRRSRRTSRSSSQALAACRVAPGALASTACSWRSRRRPTEPVPIDRDRQWAGEIALGRPAVGGFGYDPVFYDPASADRGGAAGRRQEPR